MFKSTLLKALFCWSSVLNYCRLPGCSLPRSPMFSQASSLPLHVKLYTAQTYGTGAQKQQGTPGSRRSPRRLELRQQRKYNVIIVGGAFGNRNYPQFSNNLGLNARWSGGDMAKVLKMCNIPYGQESPKIPAW